MFFKLFFRLTAAMAAVCFSVSVFAAQESNFFKVLQRPDLDDLYDIYMNCRWLRNDRIGFSHWYKPLDIANSFVRQSFEKSAQVKLELDGKNVCFRRFYPGSFWRPDKMYRSYTGSGVRLCHELAILNDQVGYRVRITGLKGKTGKMTLTLKSMGRSKGQVANGVIRFDIDRDYHRGYTQWFAVSLPQTIHAQFADVKVTPYAAGYKNPNRIDTETHAVITVPVDGKSDKIEFFLIAAIAKNAKPGTAAALALQVKDPDGFFNARHKEWQDFFTNDVPLLESSDIRLLQFYAWNFYIFKANTYLKADGSPYYICPSKEWAWLPLNWDEDSAHIISGARWFNSAKQLKMMEEMFFHFMHPASPLSYGLMTMAGWEYYLRTGDREFLQKFYDAVKRIHASYAKNKCGQLIMQRNSFLIGWDDSLRYAWGGYNKNLRNFERPILPVDLNSYLVLECRIMANAARILGKNDDIVQWESEAGETARSIQKYMWDEKSGFYYDIFADDHSKLLCKAASGFTPMCAGIPTGAQAARMLKLLKDPKEFGTRYAIPTLALSEPKRGSNWSGNIAGRNNWLVEQGLARYDRDSSAWITAKTMELFMRRHGAAAGGYQQPDRLTDHHRLFVTEIAGGLDMVVRHIIGFTPELDGFSILPAALDETMEFLRWVVNYRGKVVEIRWDRPDGKVKYSGTPEGYTVMIDGKVVYSAKSLPRVRKQITLKIKDFNRE